MVDLLYGHNETVARWVAAHIPGCEAGFNNPTAIGVLDNGKLIGGTVFHNWHEPCGVIEMSSAGTSPRWLAPKMIRAIFGYVFDQLNCQIVVMRVSERNRRMVRIAERFGFTGYLIPRLRGRDEAEWVFTLTDDTWRSHKLNRR
ncbi:GNAT family protein [Devosia algicola]|uniref:GNAT family protein n=1 Tax=Devosia algicola TaxID=3026418 RepID=A0ABY7YR07_9HYPH|nr:GNAT family protein [Devosia algicola]WDR03622.1 GNAT family protein [Devosia algicola]